MESDPKSDSSPNWERLDPLLQSALELEPDRRASFLSEACAGDGALLAEVESLLKSHEEAGSFIERPVLGGAPKQVAAVPAGSRVGRKMGPYEIQSLLGSGGMGEVYRATDTRLNRAVAVKFLPAHLSRNPELRLRLEREARAVSGLNHPHICTLYDIGRDDDSEFLVMEFLEGQSLADRLKKGPLPVEQALQYGIELADALSAAHRQGVIHRDVKPGNVMLVKNGVKLLDFGLAKVSSGTARNGDDPPTAQGTILGTLQYMAPEQLEGAEATARTDIFAFGAVLHEMVTGHAAFQGKSQASLIASIMASVPPPVSTVRPVVPEALDHVIQRCLAKDPEERWQSAYDLKRELQWIAGTVAKPASPPVNPFVATSNRRVWLGAAIGAAAGLAAGAGIKTWHPSTISSADSGKHALLVPEGTLLAAVGKYMGPAVSPDGSRIVLAATKSGQTQLYWKSWRSPEWTLIPGTEGGHSPFWNPNSQEIGFFADGYLKTANLFSGRASTLCQVTQTFDNQGKGGAWNDSGDIIFAGLTATPIYHVRISDPTGKKAVTSVDAHERRHCWPCFLPDQKHFLYLGYTREDDRGIVYAGSLDSPVKKPVLREHDSGVIYAAGHLLYVKQDVNHRRLYAWRFNVGTLETEGDPFVVDDGPVMVTEFRACFSAADNGRLVFYGLDNSRINRFHRDRQGAKEPIIGLEGRFKSLRLSPDSQKLFYSMLADWGDRMDRKIYIRNLRSGITDSYNGKGTLRAFAFSSDSRQAFFSGGLGADRQANPRMVFRTTLTPENKVEDLLEDEPDLTVLDVSYNDKFLLLLKRPTGEQKQHLWYSQLSEASGKVVAEATKPFDVVRGVSTKEGRFSPRGLKDLWVAYVSDESDGEQVYIRRFPTGEKKQISREGGNWPVWTKGGREIVYLSRDNVLTAVSLEEKGSDLTETGRERFPFSFPDWSTGRGQRAENVKYDITPDGNLIYAIESLPTPVFAMDNWHANTARSE